MHDRLRTILLVACLALAGSWAQSTPPAATGVALPPVSAAPPAAVDAEIELVEARLRAGAHALLPEECSDLARTIVEASRAHDLPVELVLGVIHVESRFDPHAVSPVGALGLMQVMPATGLEVARRLGEPWAGRNTLFDPQANVRIGVAYLRQLHDRYANTRAALAAYNWGPGKIDARLRAGRALPVQYPKLVFDAVASG